MKWFVREVVRLVLFFLGLAAAVVGLEKLIEWLSSWDDEPGRSWPNADEG